MRGSVADDAIKWRKRGRSETNEGGFGKRKNTNSNVKMRT